MKNYYETVFIIDPGLPDEVTNQIIEKVTDIIKKHQGEILELDRMGKRRLAYEINKRQYGFYVVMEHETEPAVNKEFEEYFNINENILRYMTVRYTKKDLKNREFQRAKEAARKEKREKENS
ncbi:30S ribosomal protein S6 [candidate division KSB1 bacterium]